MTEMLSHWIETKGDTIFSPESKKAFNQDVMNLNKLLIKYNLDISASMSKRILSRLKDKNIKADSFLKSQISELIVRIQDELKNRLVFLVTSDEARYYKPKVLIYGKDIEHKLNELIEDISEAGNCYALSRYTASVFHLMRVMEKAVQSLANKLNLPITLTYDKEWQSVINDIRGELNRLYVKHNDPERVRYESILGHLETVKIAWRNPTMHPKATYTEEEAKALLDAVGIFLKQLIKVL